MTPVSFMPLTKDIRDALALFAQRIQKLAFRFGAASGMVDSAGSGRHRAVIWVRASGSRYTDSSGGGNPSSLTLT